MPDAIRVTHICGGNDIGGLGPSSFMAKPETSRCGSASAPRAQRPQPLSPIALPITLSPPPLSPPPLQHTGSPYACVPLPPVPEDYFPPPPSINRILRFSLEPNIDFDLLLHPSTITTLPDHRPLSLHTLAEPATNPRLRRITIVSPRLPWPITVSPPLPHDANKIVTVYDVLVTLHHVLALTVTVSESGQLPSRDAVLGVNAADECRVNRTPRGWDREAERLKGLKVVDFLIGRHRFLGLSRMGMDPDVFVLNVF